MQPAIRRNPMSTAIKKSRMLLVAAGIGAAIFMFGSSANAAQCRSTFDAAGDPVVMCGSIAYYADDEGDDDEGYDEDMHDEYGSLFVDPEDCEPGKYWMMDIDDEIPIACR
jgi:hypothetical protein